MLNSKKTMSKLLAVFSLFLYFEHSLGCVDILFTVDNKDEHSLSRAINVASGLRSRPDIRTTVAVNRDGRYIARMIRSSRELFSVLEAIDADYDSLLKVVAVEISRRRHNSRPLIVLLFSENDVNSSQMEMWKALKKTTLHVFRVGTAKQTSELFAGQGTSFDDLLRCPEEKLTIIDNDIRRRPQNEVTKELAPRVANVFRHLTNPATATTRHQLASTTRTPHTTSRFSRTTPKPLTTTSKPVFSSDLPAERGAVRPFHPTRIIQLTKATALKGAESNFHAITTTTHRSSTSGRPTTTTSQATTTARAPPGCVADIMFVMDFSQGTGDRSRSYFDIAATAVGTLPIAPNAVRIGMIGYSGPGRAQVLFHLDKHDNKDDVIEEMFRMESAGGTTRTGEAIRFAVKTMEGPKHGARKAAKRVIVVFTDGFSQDDPSEAADEARAAGFLLLAVTSEGSPAPNLEELVEISGNKEVGRDMGNKKWI